MSKLKERYEGKTFKSDHYGDFVVYKRFKEAHIKSLAEKWKDQIDVRVYEALMNWTAVS